MNKLPVKYTLLAILACLLWSTAFVGVKIGLQYSKNYPVTLKQLNLL